jgi:hypothetical protein
VELRPSILETLRDKARLAWREAGLLQEPIAVRARTLTAEEAIGHPEGDDFPLQKGKERLMEATFQGSRGQAFTDRFGDFSGSLADVAAMELTNNFRRAVLIAAVNATARHLGLCDRTVHCRDKEPGQCAGLFSDHLRERFGSPRIAQVGYQPQFIEALAKNFELRVLDLDPDNIGTIRHGAPVEGPSKQLEVLDWADLWAVTGSTLSNDTLGDFLCGKPVIFYGTTVAGAAALLGLERFCAMAT